MSKTYQIKFNSELRRSNFFRVFHIRCVEFWANKKKYFTKNPGRKKYLTCSIAIYRFGVFSRKGHSRKIVEIIYFFRNIKISLRKSLFRIFIALLKGSKVSLILKISELSYLFISSSYICKKKKYATDKTTTRASLKKSNTTTFIYVAKELIFETLP